MHTLSCEHNCCFLDAWTVHKHCLQSMCPVAQHINKMVEYVLAFIHFIIGLFVAVTTPSTNAQCNSCPVGKQSKQRERLKYLQMNSWIGLWWSGAGRGWGAGWTPPVTPPGAASWQQHCDSTYEPQAHPALKQSISHTAQTQPATAATADGEALQAAKAVATQQLCSDNAALQYSALTCLDCVFGYSGHDRRRCSASRACQNVIVTTVLIQHKATKPISEACSDTEACLCKHMLRYATNNCVKGYRWGEVRSGRVCMGRREGGGGGGSDLALLGCKAQGGHLLNSLLLTRTQPPCGLPVAPSSLLGSLEAAVA